MRLPDNSDAACLIKADWLEDHGQVAEARELREEVTEGTHAGGIGSGVDDGFGYVGGGIGGGLGFDFYSVGGVGAHIVGSSIGGGVTGNSRVGIISIGGVGGGTDGFGIGIGGDTADDDGGDVVDGGNY